MAEAGDLDSEAEEHTGEEDASDIKSMNATAAADGDDDDEASTMSGDPVEIASEDIGDNSVLDSDHDEDNPEPRTKRRRVNPEPVDTVPSATQGQSLQNKERLTAVAMGYPSNPAERLEAATDHISTLLRTANRARHALGRNLVPVTNQDGEFPPRALSPIDSAMVLKNLAGLELDQWFTFYDNPTTNAERRRWCIAQHIGVPYGFNPVDARHVSAGGDLARFAGVEEHGDEVD